MTRSGTLTSQIAPTTPHTRVAVIVPCFNAATFLAECLDSVRAQTLQTWECIVVDDGSVDDTAAVAERYVAIDPRIRLLRQPNRGTSTARNAGIAATTDDVEFLAFLDGDDTWLPDTLEVLVGRLSPAGDAVGAYGLAEYMDTTGRPIRSGEHSAGQRDRRRMGRFDLAGVGDAEPYTFASMVVSGTIWPSGVGLHRRDVVERVGGFDPELRQVQDWDLYLRMSRQGAFVPVDRQVAWYRQHDTNVTHRSENVAYYTLLVRWKAWRSTDNTPAQRTLNRRVWRRLTMRWVAWSALAELRALRHVRPHDAAHAQRALLAFAGALVAGHPPRPDRRLADLVATYVTSRRTGGSPDRP